jgi:hypothetical protein
LSFRFCLPGSRFARVINRPGTSVALLMIDEEDTLVIRIKRLVEAV